jgi:hypothetical protein
MEKGHLSGVNFSLKEKQGNALKDVYRGPQKELPMRLLSPTK